MSLQSSSSSYSAHPFSSSFIRYEWKYDVFISFRGRDTRYDFTGNLYKALCDKGILTFFDDGELQSGEEITPALLKAIEESRIAIVVLSPNYASSSFCLDELVHVLHCIKGNNRFVLPVFFKVDPSDVRHLKNSFGEAMDKHEKRYKDDMNKKVDKWKKALPQVANLSGYHFKDGHGYEHQFIKKIVQDISRKIGRLPLPVADFPVGLESPVSEVISLLEMDSTDRVHMVGIHGIGGIGKTTLALALYNFIADNFKGVCFLENVRENSQKYGLVHLQNNLLCKILGKEGVQIIGVKEGISQIQRRLSQTKVLLVLDDVDEHEQLTAIAGKPDWFHPGSRIIITTRDKHLLTLHDIERTYEVQGLNEEESLDLLQWKAFKTDIINPRYKNVLTRAVTYASGLPLALEVIGSNLFGKDLEQWESAMDQYEEVLDNKIRKILQVSFDALGEDVQSVFLDIACCFKGYKSVEVTAILQAQYGRSMKYHIGMLVEKSLIKIDHLFRITLHDLIEDMGKDICREKSSKVPGKHSRLWFYKDIVKVLEDNQGTSAIEIIHLEFPLFRKEGGEDPSKKEKNDDVEVKWDGTAFKEMKNLKTLIIKNGRFSRGPKYLPNSLRVLEWRRYPSRYFPSNFDPEKLSILKLPDYLYMSPKLDSISKMLITLKVLSFDYSDSLKEIPDVSNIQTLEEFSFEGCSNLVSVHSSVGFLPKLRILNAEKCPKLRSFPPVINLPSLEMLGLSGCSSLEKFPEIPEEMKNLEELDLIGTGIQDLPCSFCNLSRLWHLYLEENKMHKIPSVICMMPSLDFCNINLGGNKGRVSGEQEEGLHGIFTHSLPSSDMEHLSLKNSNLSDEFFPLAVAWFPNVEFLDLTGNNFTVFPECIQQFRFLKILKVDDCEHLREIRGIPPCLTDFSAVNCKSLSPRGTSVLLNQQVHEGRSTHFVMPGGSIPRGFEWRSSGASISFWFRGTIFPYKSLCVAILLKHDILSPPLQVKPTVTINGNQVQFGRYGLMGQLFIFNLKRDDYYYEAPHFKRGWNHVKLSYEAYYKGFEGKVPSESIGKEIGMHVWKEESSSIMEDIRFTDPYKMTQLIIMMIMLSIAFPNHKNHPLLLQTCIGYWTLLFLTMYDLDNDSELGSEGSNISDGSMASTELAGAELGCAQM
ncbi:TMV resistance protein N [Arachis ipaensis]|uniref:TMV resistance protein N n=1 Tax=Arachis ipaensis TaxID=130454 RepID=UPI0007AF17D0|nr:TMV resistance protein N [Arachis ipaensis]